jgi:hypothetical protein
MKFFRAVVGVRNQGLYVIYCEIDDWPHCFVCSASVWLVPDSEAEGTAFVEAARLLVTTFNNGEEEDHAVEV